MNLIRIKHIDQLVIKAKDEFQKGQHHISWQLLEEAHIFSQPFSLIHSYVHWEMLVLSFKTNDRAEFFGQILRLVLAAPSSILKTYPTGNNGRSRAGLFTHFKISNILEKKLIKLDKLEAKRIKSGGKIVKYIRKHPIRYD
ncbi:MAG: DUF3703 domain-containing protein [Pseudobdellovibrio sp.]